MTEKIVFENYSHNGIMTPEDFLRLIRVFSQKKPELANFDETQALVAYERYANSKMTYENFLNFWRDPLKFSLIAGPKAPLLKKAHSLYKKYSETGEMDYENFLKLLKAYGREGDELDFGDLDKNEDGILSFSELCDWLGWFSKE